MQQQRTLIKACVALWVAGGMGLASAQMPTAKVIELSASLNEMALSCGDVTAAELKDLQAKQRAQLVDSQMSGSAYDQAYSQAREAFLSKWKAGTPEQRKQSCQHMQRGQAQGKAAKP